MNGTPEVLRERAEHHAREAERLDARQRHPALVDFAHCVRAWGGLVARGQLRSPKEYVGTHLHFRDGTTSLVFRETVRRAPTLEPALLVIQFRLAALGSNRWAHAAFRRECVLHTPLFAGFPGFRSKLWADDVTTGIYRGIYEWDGAEAARAYAIRMVGLLAPFSNADTARFHVVGGLRRDTFLRDPLAAPSDGADGWWRIEQPVEPSSPRRFPDVALKHRLSDASYRFYDRSRHQAAFEAAAKPGTAPDFSSLQGRKYALLVTFRKDGTAVPTPVWFALLDNRHLVTRTEERTAKVRRLRSDARARVFPCDPRGKPLGPGVEGRVRLLPAGVECDRAEAALDHHYGRTRRIYEKLMADESGMVYLEVVPAA